MEQAALAPEPEMEMEMVKVNGVSCPSSFLEPEYGCVVKKMESVKVHCVLCLEPVMRLENRQELSSGGSRWALEAELEPGWKQPVDGLPA